MSYRQMTVAQIRERSGADHAEVAFLESARFYRLPRTNRAYQKLLQLLREAINKKRVVKVRFLSPNSDVIEDVQVP